MWQWDSFPSFESHLELKYGVSTGNANVGVFLTVMQRDLIIFENPRVVLFKVLQIYPINSVGHCKQR